MSSPRRGGTLFRAWKNLLFLCVIIFTSCGPGQEEEIDNAIVSAKADLTRGACTEAIKKLQLVGVQHDNAEFLKVFATAYACRAGYTTTKFFQDDLTQVNSSNFLSSFTLFSTSTMSALPNADSDFIDINAAIELLLFAGGVASQASPTSELRKQNLTDRESAQVHSLLMFLLMVQLGKFTDYFGNTSTAGVKGGGTDFLNDCFLNYDDLDAASMAALLGAGSSGNCTNGDLTDGHPQLIDSGSVDIENACYGVVYFNALVDVIPEVIESAAGDDFSAIGDVVDAINTLKTNLGAIIGGASNVLNETNYDTCVEDNASDDDHIQYYYAAIFEQLHNLE